MDEHKGFCDRITQIMCTRWVIHSFWSSLTICSILANQESHRLTTFIFAINLDEAQWMKDEVKLWEVS